MRLDGKVAIVTGGAMGNGLGIAEVLLKAGAMVYIFDYSDKLRDTIKDLKSRYNTNVKGFILDIRNMEAIEGAVKKIISEQNKIDILVNNAGVLKLGNFLSMSDEVRDYHFDINIKGTWNVTKAVVPFMKEKGGKIVNLSSVTGPMVADKGEVAYATTKAALLGFTKSLAMELVEDKILVNAIMPGYIMTPMVEKVAKESDSTSPEKVIDGIASGIPMKRLGTIEELGNLALFLVSEENSYITGQGIVIDGGSTLPETNSVGV